MIIDLSLDPTLLFLAIVVSTFIVEDPTTLAVSLFINNKQMSYEMGLSALAVGIFLGDLGLYILGYGIHRGFFKQKKEFLTPSFTTVALARFIPGMRTITFSAAGFNNIGIKKFIIIILPSSIIWTVLIFKFSEQIFFVFRDWPVWVSLLVGMGFFISINYIVKRVRR